MSFGTLWIRRLQYFRSSTKATFCITRCRCSLLFSPLWHVVLKVRSENDQILGKNDLNGKYVKLLCHFSIEGQRKIASQRSGTKCAIIMKLVYFFQTSWSCCLLWNHHLLLCHIPVCTTCTSYWVKIVVCHMFEQEAQLMLTTGSTRLAVSRGQQTWYHFGSIATFR